MKPEARGGPGRGDAAAGRAPAAGASAVRPGIRPLLALWALALVAYANSFVTGFPGDNALLILGDARIQSASAQNFGLIWSKDYWFGHVAGGVYRPLATLSHWFNYALLGNGAHPAGYHWFNFSVHAANIALVYWLGLLIAPAVAFAVAALWAVHPVLTESVTNIIGRSDEMAAFGVLAALVCYVMSTRAAARVRSKWLVGVLAASAIGIFSKENAVVLLAAMALYDLSFGVNGRWRERAPGYLAALLPFALFLAMRGAVLRALPNTHLPPTDNPLFMADFVTARLTAIAVLGKYLALLCWPATLSSDYSYNQIPLFRAADWPWIAAFAAPLALAVCAWRWSRPAFFFAMFGFAALAPTANVFLLIGTIMGERFLYLPAIGFAACLALALYRFAGARANYIVAAICLVFAMRTWARNGDWQDQYTLWSSAAAASPNSFKAHLSLGYALPGPDASNIDRVVAEADRVVTILGPLADKWNSTRAWEAAGIWYRTKGDLSAADQRRGWYEKSLAALERGARVDRAYTAETRRIDIAQGKTPTGVGWFPIYGEIARTCLRLGETSKAMAAIRDGQNVAIAPPLFEVLSEAYRQSGDTRAAEVALLQAIILSPAQVSARGELLRLYRETAPGSCAIGAGGLNLACLMVHTQVCEASVSLAGLYRERGRAAEAEAMQRSAEKELGCTGK
jgi:hypothetical protein